MRGRNAIPELLLCLCGLFCAGARAPALEVEALYATWYLDGEKPTYVLTLRNDRTFALIGPDGFQVSGKFFINRNGDKFDLIWEDKDRGLTVGRQWFFQVKGPVLTLDSQKGDRPVPGVTLGDMPPVSGKKTYLGQARWKELGRPADPPKPAAPPPAATIASTTPPTTAAAGIPPATAAAPAAQFVVPSGAKPVESLAAIAGSYSHRTGPLVTETWTIQEDGKFRWQDSYGSDVSGVAKLEGGRLSLEAGGVARSFAASVEGGRLFLVRGAEDRPGTANALCAMSPSSLPAAKYVKRER
jgi:hypothetical protein